MSHIICKVTAYACVLSGSFSFQEDILYERKCVREDASVGGNVKTPMSHTVFNVTAYACVLSDTFSLLEDI